MSASARVSSAPCDSEAQPTKSEVATLSHAEIARMSPSEMLRVIAVADLPFLQQTTLAHQSTETLRQLTHLASFCCRNVRH